MRRVVIPTYTAAILLGGDLRVAELCAGQYCAEVGYCVTLEPITFIWGDGECEGVRVGLINYGRFPARPEVIFGHAEALARRLMSDLRQDTASIVATDQTVWLSTRPADVNPPA